MPANPTYPGSTMPIYVMSWITFISPEGNSHASTQGSESQYVWTSSLASKMSCQSSSGQPVCQPPNLA